MYIFFDGEIKNKQSITLEADNEGLLYGYGLFETVRVSKGRPCFLNEHLQRMQKSGDLLQIPWDQDCDTIRYYANELIDKNQVEEGRLRISYIKNKAKNILIMTVNDRIYSKASYEKGFSLWLSNIKRIPESLLVRVKSINYLENILAKQDAMQHSYDEAIFLNTQNYLCEGASSNLFWIKNDILFSPAVECGLLPGIVREKILTLAEALGIQIITGKHTIDELLAADEVFATNSILGVMPVVRALDTQYNREKYSLTKKIMHEYDQLLENEIKR